MGRLEACEKTISIPECSKNRTLKSDLDTISCMYSKTNFGLLESSRLTFSNTLQGPQMASGPLAVIYEPRPVTIYKAN